MVATQSIGAVNSGRLENAVNILNWQKEHAPAGFNVIRPFRKTHFATNEMAYILRIIGKTTLNTVPSYVVPVGDISLEKGGTIYNDQGKARHKSHKTGRDADVGYYYENKTLMTNLFSAVKNKKSWMPEQQWALFKTIVRTQYIDRIFVHPALKRELCDVAIKKGEIDKNAKSGVAFETLRRLIPDSGHDTHFHVRVKCSKAQYACKQMVDPEAKTGCF
ncbi:penicillin-insensitive murein endopeptidase [Bdellovibrio bacteriovorus]